MAIRDITVGVIKVDDDSDTLTDISSQTADLQLQMERNSGTYNVLNSGHMKTSEGARSHTLTGNVIATDGATEGLAILQDWAQTGGLRTVELYAPDETSGSLKWVGEARLSSWTPLAKDASSGDVARHAFTIVFDDMTESTVAP